MATKIGHIDKDGMPVFPDHTIAGRPFDETEPRTLHMLPEGRFLVIDTWLPPGFDLEAELAKYKPTPTLVEATDNATGRTVTVPIGGLSADTPFVPQERLGSKSTVKNSEKP